MSAFNLSSSSTFLAHQSLTKYFAPAPSTARGEKGFLAAHPREPKLIYASGKYAVILDVNTKETFVYRGHNVQVTAARFSSTGNWVATGDVSGKVRIWAWDNPEHQLKIEHQVFSGSVRDLAWDSESKRICAVGEGGGKNAAVFSWDSGNSLGELNAHGKRVLGCSFKPQRPFRLVTASEDQRTAFYQGPPFKMDHTNGEHSNWVNGVQYSPDGEVFVTVSSDKKICIYEGKTGELKDSIPNAHAGTIYDISFLEDSTKFITSSADKTCKLWNLASKECEATFTFTSDIFSMQTAITSLSGSNHSFASLSLNGDINLLDLANQSGPTSVFQGHQVGITSLAVDGSSGVFFTCDYEGVIMKWDLNNPEISAQKLSGEDKKSINNACHQGRIVDLVLHPNNSTLQSVGFDDKLRICDKTIGTFGANDAIPSVLNLSSQPKAIEVTPEGLVVVLMHDSIAIYDNFNVKLEEKIASFEPMSLAVKNDDEIAIGGKDRKVYIYNISSGSTFELTKTIEGPQGEIACIQYSPDGQYLAMGDSNREVQVFDATTWENKIRNKFVFHTTRVTSLAWHADSKRIITGSGDASMILWNIETPMKRKAFNHAHKDGVSKVAWVSENEVVSVGADACVGIWDVTK